MKLAKRRDQVEKFEPVPKGRYSARIEEAEEGISSNDNPQINLLLRITDHKEFSGRRLRDWIVNVENTVWKINQLLDAAGIEGDGDTFDEQELVDKVVDVRVSVVPDRNDPEIKRNKINKYFAKAKKQQGGLSSK